MTTTVPEGARDAEEAAAHRCMEALARSVTRLSIEVGRMDAIDLAAPWCDGEPTRRDRVIALIAWLEPGAVPADAGDGGSLAAALVRAWAHRRERETASAPDDGQSFALTVRQAVDDVRVALDIGVDRDDLGRTSSR